MHCLKRLTLAVAAVAAALAAAACVTPVTHGVAAGDVTTSSAVIWSRTERESVMHLQLLGPHAGADVLHLPVGAGHDYTGQIEVQGLKPDTEYRYRVWFGSGRDDAATTGQFRTAPAARDAAPVAFAWGGDVAGQNVCRDRLEGFPIFQAINALLLDFFIGLGDMIYADDVCDATGRYSNAQVPGGFPRAANPQDYWAHWKYNREDSGYRALLGALPYYAIWDDHEVVNDFGPWHDTRSTPPYTAGVHLMPLGLAAFHDYNPISARGAAPQRLYRNIRWGKHLELFILDTRRYRDANSATDAAARPKTLLGREQRVWLKHQLQASDATWKVIVSSVPMAIPTGSPELGRDGWANFDQATGFENELLDVLRKAKQQGSRNLVWITTDVHCAAVFRYTPFTDDAAFKVHEFATGPLNAGLFPSRDFDTTLNTERLFLYGPATNVTTWEQAKPWMNFGHMQIDRAGRLTTAVRNVNGAAVFELTLTPQ